jgi:hypothetical protein
MIKQLEDGINECSNEVYHADRKYLSSSVLKTIYKSLNEYHDQYILGNKKQFANENALVEGSMVHTKLLEPHELHKQYVFWDGIRKAGSEWEKFKASLDPADTRTVIAKPQKLRVDSYIEAFNRRAEAVEMLKNGQPELTLCGTLHNVPIKVRFDYINVEKGCIYDVKTTGRPADVENFKATLEGLSYQLSAALYTAMAEQYYGRKFDFYFIVISKQDPQECHVYKTSAATMANGRQMVKQACEKYLIAKETNNWTEIISEPEVSSYEILEV